MLALERPKGEMQTDSLVASPGAVIFEHRDPAIVADVQERHGQALFGYARRLGLSDEQAADAVQEALVRLWRELRGSGSIESPTAWTFRTVHHLAMDQHRLRRRIEALTVALGRRTDPEPREAVDRIAVWGEVDRLPSRQRQVLYLHYRADLSFDEVGAVLGITAGAARSHASRGIEELRTRFSAGGGDR
jgi:RNA polymerase sigma factor (sigma-70 family)